MVCVCRFLLVVVVTQKVVGLVLAVIFRGSWKCILPGEELPHITQCHIIALRVLKISQVLTTQSFTGDCTSEIMCQWCSLTRLGPPQNTNGTFVPASQKDVTVFSLPQALRNEVQQWLFQSKLASLPGSLFKDSQIKHNQELNVLANVLRRHDDPKDLTGYKLDGVIPQ